MKNTVSIIYSQRLIAEALKSIIENETEFRVVKMLNFKLREEIEKNSTVLFEINYPNALLIDFVLKLKSQGYKIFIVGLIQLNDLVGELLNSGVDAYVLKSCSKRNLIMAFDQLANEKKYFCSSITESLNKKLNNISENKQAELTEREREILKGIVNFKSTNQIADILNISIATVRTHRKNIMSKFGSKNYIGLLRRACSLGLLTDDDHNFCEGCAKVKCQSTQSGYSC